jgi:hypothetical protein
MPRNSSTSPDEAFPFAGIAESDWNACNRGGNPFTDHRFLGALRSSASVRPQTGWTDVSAEYAQPDSFAPVWQKTNSHGEFVFDFAWADAAHRAGLRWYPKLLVAAPLTPVTGPRLLGKDPDARSGLLGRLTESVEAGRFSSCSINFCDEADRQLLAASEWLGRWDWQYHWFNDDYADFDAFLARLRSKPRKNIRRERRLAHADGWEYRWIDGDSASDEELRTVHDCYRTTFLLYRNLPSLNLPFFQRAARAFGRRFLVCMASQHGEDLACSVFWRSDRRLYGRYWGARTETRDVHFEACYYQGIQYCIEHGLDAFEPGAQGEHKIRRGFVPVRTFSFHYIRHEGLREGVRRWLLMEQRALEEYRRELRSLEPYREPSAAA